MCLVPSAGGAGGGAGGGGGGGGGSSAFSSSAIVTAKSMVLQQVIATTAVTQTAIAATTTAVAFAAAGPCTKKRATSTDSDKCNVKPGEVGTADDAFFFQASYGVNKFSDDASVLGTQQKAQSWSMTAGIQRDFDDWGYTLAVPVSQTRNNGGYATLDSTSVGVQFSPRYHFLLAQVHGVSLDFGAQLGYNHIWYDDLAGMNDPTGAFALVNFSNLSTANYGVSADISMPVAVGTAVSGHIGAADFINLDNKALMGSHTTMLNWNIGLSQVVTEKISAYASLGKSHIRLIHFDDTYNYGVMNIGGAYSMNSRGSLSLNLSRSLSGRLITTTSGMLNFSYQLD